MSNNRGQVTIFIIIAVVLISAIALFLTFKDNLIIGTSNLGVDNVKLFVEECIKDVGTDVIYTIGEGGGYYFPAEVSTDSRITYYLFGNKNYMPSKEKVEQEISNYVSEKLFFCVGNFSDFPELEIGQREIKTTTEIRTNEVILNVNYPLSITKGEKTSIVKSFDNIEIPIRLGVVYDAVDESLKSFSKENGECLSCILDVVIKNDLYVEMLDYDNETVIFTFKDENSKLNDVAFEWIYANKY